MKIQGNAETRQVWIDGILLDPAPSQAAFNHSPDGFGWAYCGSGPAQLALAILMHTTDIQTAITLHQSFKSRVIATLPNCDFNTEIDVQAFVKKARASMANNQAQAQVVEKTKAGKAPPITDMIASGYEWVCPICEELNHEIETKEGVTCWHCHTYCKVNIVEHALG